MRQLPSDGYFYKQILNDFPQKQLNNNTLRIWPHLLKKSLMENFIFCAVYLLKFTIVFLSKVAFYSHEYVLILLKKRTMRYVYFFTLFIEPVLVLEFKLIE